MVMNVYYNIIIISMFLITRKPEHPFTLMDLLGYLVYGLPVHIMCLFFLLLWLILIFALLYFLLMHRVVALYTPSIFKVLAGYTGLGQHSKCFHTQQRFQVPKSPTVYITHSE